MKYKLKTTKNTEEDEASIGDAFKGMLALMGSEKKSLGFALIAILVNAGMNLLGPLVVGYTIDNYVIAKQFGGVIEFSLVLCVIYATALVGSYLQTTIMGRVGQRTLYKLRNSVFSKLQDLPVAFFTQNKAGDLISRINNDTNRLNDFFSFTLMQFLGNAFTIVGAAIFIVAINWRLGLAALAPALAIAIFTKLISNWVKNANLRSLRAEGSLSSEVQESLENFKVIIAFDRRDYLKKRFAVVSQENFTASIRAGLGSNIFGAIYDFASNVAQLIVLIYGIYLISLGQLQIGLLVSYLLYIARFYDPLRSFASFWSQMQIALAGWDRISEITNLTSDLTTVPAEKGIESRSIMRFDKVSFSYPDTSANTANISDGASGTRIKQVLHDINFDLEKGKTYALVGPTGGGKTTTASLTARLFDPTTGTIYLNGKDIRSYSDDERTQKIGFILQEPFLFSGTVKENIIYGNPLHKSDISSEDVMKILKTEKLEGLLAHFEDGLETKVSGNSDSISLGQKQLLAFIRAVLRKPELLILDEATANIDTVTEQLLETILKSLPSETTKVIIAHRLNTIESADEIFFVNGGTITPAGSMEHAVDMLLHNKRQS